MAPDISVLVNDGEPPLRLASDGKTTAAWMIGLLYKGEHCEKVALMRQDGLLLRHDDVVLPGSYRLLGCAAPPVRIRLPAAAEQVKVKPQHLDLSEVSSSVAAGGSDEPPAPKRTRAAVAAAVVKRGRGNAWTEAEIHKMESLVKRHGGDSPFDWKLLRKAFPNRSDSAIRHRYRRCRPSDKEESDDSDSSEASGEQREPATQQIK
jgi:hypothetical protein